MGWCFPTALLFVTDCSGNSLGLSFCEKTNQMLAVQSPRGVVPMVPPGAGSGAQSVQGDVLTGRCTWLSLHRLRAPPTSLGGALRTIWGTCGAQLQDVNCEMIGSEWDSLRATGSSFSLWQQRIKFQRRQDCGDPVYGMD